MRATRAEADRKREEGDWAGAAALYADMLRDRADDPRLRIQLGHCLKEMGDLRGALEAYRAAERRLMRDAELKLHLGEMLARLGDLAGARATYAAALEIAPGNEAAWQAASVLLGKPGAIARAEPGLSLLGDVHLVFDLSDLMAWFDAQRAPSGIQRVQLELVIPMLRAGAPAASLETAVFRPESGTWRPLPREILRRLIALVRDGADPADPAWSEAVVRARDAIAAAPDLAFTPGAWLVNCGSSWWLPNYHLAVRAARARDGIRYAALLHDCGPVVLPEHSPPEATRRFARWLSEMSAQADLLLAVSEATARDLAALRLAHLDALPAAPLAILRPDAAPTALPAREHPGVRALQGTAYILFLATVESRKDHLFVLNAWLALLRRRQDLPRLVLAGRPGFGAGPALDLLARAPALAEHVVRLEDVPDGALAELLGGALFTLYHSRHEGWGLPVTEALAAGKVVVAAAVGGLLESGAGLALHYAPGSEPDFLAIIEKLIDDPAFRATREARIAAEFRPRSWQQVSDGLVRLLGATPERTLTPAPLPLGTIHPLGAIARGRPGAAMAWADLLRAGEGWLAPESWGCPTRPGRATLRLPLDVPPQTALRLHLALRGATMTQRISITLDAGDPLEIEITGAATPIAAFDILTTGPTLEIDIESEQGIGVVALMACRADDLAARLDFLERTRFLWPELA